MSNKWIGWIRTKSNRLESSTFTTLNNNIHDATAEVASRTGAKYVSLYPTQDPAPAPKIPPAVATAASVAAGAGTAFTESDFGFLIIGGLAIIFWPITLTIFIIWFIRWWRKRDVIRGLISVFVSYLPWSIKLPLRRRYEWLN